MNFIKVLAKRNSFFIPQINKSWSTIAAHLEHQINKDLENELYKPKSHPGRCGLGVVVLPERIQNAIKVAVKDDQIPQLIDDGKKLDRYLFSRQVPLEQTEIFLIKKQIERDMIPKSSETDNTSKTGSEEESRQMKDMFKQEVLKTFYKKNYNWQPILYDSYKAWTYLFGRAAKEYAAIRQVFNEIVKRDTEFQPHSFFDFGAGVGTGTWAASEIFKNSLHEYFLVDESRDMNDLSELLLRDGNEDKNITVKNVFYRQFLPASDEFKSHLILSAFTLNELPNLKTRLNTLQTLWKKCDGYMVLIENGTNAGFKLIEEARAFILQQSIQDNSAYLFAPCPHEMPCPRMLKNDGTPCNFPARYRTLGIGQSKQETKMQFSYVVFKKGSRSDDNTINWPRLVRPTQVRTRHTRCKLCTSRGQLQEIVFTKAKHSTYTYRCARKSDCGDRLPIKIDENHSVKENE